MSVTSTQIKQALLKYYAPPSHRVFFEVSNDTGVRASRWIDAVAVGIWPSTGYEIIGIEIKVSRGDWKRELALPEKAQSLMRFCTRWYLACPDGLVKPDELPGTWGMLTLKDDGAVKQKVVAKLLDPEPLTPGFMMAVLRNASAVDMELVAGLVADEAKKRDARFNEEVERAAQRRHQDLGVRHKRALDIASKLEAIAGEPINNWSFDAKALAAAYQFLKLTGLHESYAVSMSDLPGIVQGLARAQSALAEMANHPLIEQMRSAMRTTREAAQ